MWSWIRSTARRCVQAARSGLRLARSAVSSVRRGIQSLWRRWQTEVPTWLKCIVYLWLAFAIILLILFAIGFTPTGVAAGSAAAAWQSSIGNVASWTLFSTFQSVTMSAITYIILWISAGLLGPMVLWRMIGEQRRRALQSMFCTIIRWIRCWIMRNRYRWYGM